MATRDFHLSMNRRCLLTSAAAMTAAGIVPGADPANASVVLPSALTPEVPVLNVSAATARRLLEIARRNEVRRQAGLPLLSIPEELRRMWLQQELVEFERFEAAHGAAVWEQVLEPRRGVGREPKRLSWIEGVWYQKQVREILRKQFSEARVWPHRTEIAPATMNKCRGPEPPPAKRGLCKDGAA